MRVSNTNRKSSTFHLGLKIEDAEHFHTISRDGVFFIDYADVAKAKGFNQSLNDFVVRHRSVGSGCLGNGDLRQLCPPHLGQRTGDKRACAHTYFLSLFVWI